MAEVPWIFTEGGAGWTFGIISLLVAIGTAIYRRRPHRVIFRDIETASLINVGPDIRERIKVSYEGGEIQSLGFVKGELSNPGADVIRNASIEISVPPNSRILDVSVLSSLGACKPVIKANHHSSTIAIPFLNPYAGHHHVLIFRILYDGSPRKLNITGSGPGWSLKRIPVGGPQAKRWQVIASSAGLLGLILWSRFWYIPWLQQTYGISESEISLRALLSTLPVIVPLLLWAVWLIQPSLRRTTNFTRT
jgi:hypothetical protein